MSRLFDSYLMVDWSGAPKPVTNEDSVWWALARDDTVIRIENPATRQSAMEAIADAIADERLAGRRILVGFDFPFGYPTGTAKAFGAGGNWRSIWEIIASKIQDDERNCNNRFDVARQLNDLFPGPGPFWATLPTNSKIAIPRSKPTGYGTIYPPEYRRVEAFGRGRGAQPKSVWQLSGPGNVGGQVLMGIAWLERLRTDPRLHDMAIWPFETALSEPQAPIVLAEIYPSLFRVRPKPNEVLDAAQVRTVAEVLASLDGAEQLGELFHGPSDIDAATREVVCNEEAWILGLGHEEKLQTEAPSNGRHRYERDPTEIYRQSFAIVENEARLDHLPDDLRTVAIRLVHACGMPDITARLAWSADVAERAATALRSGAPILCDCEAVAAMVIRRSLPADNRVLCTLNEPAVPGLAEEIGNTRSAAAVDLWRDHLEGSVIAIGNAPTALFRLMERLDEGWPRPAAILGFPVGFVGAAESKAALANDPRGAPYLTLRGRRGGSAMAAAAVNALAAQAGERG